MLITSRDNPTLKHLRSLLDRKHRARTRLFVVEGIRHVGEASAAEAAMECLCYAPELLTSGFAWEVIAAERARDTPCYAVSAAAFATLAEKEHPAGLLAVVRQPHRRLEELRPEAFPRGVALVSPQDPGNVGAVLRTAAAVGASGLLLLDGGADPYHPRAVRASLGAHFSLPVVQATFPAFVRWAKAGGYRIWGASARAGQDYRAVATYPRPTLLLLGNEQTGLTPPQLEACDDLVRLPVQGNVTSLNLAVAAGVLLYDMLAKGDR
jgi:RNA methyltransferase, TrmH family